MKIGYILFLFFVISVSLALRLKNKITRIFTIGAISSFFLAMTFVSVIPATEVTDGRTFFIAFTLVIGSIFTVIALVNIFVGNIGKKKTAKN